MTHLMNDGRPCGLEDGHLDHHRFNRTKTSRTAHKRYNQSAKGILRSIRYEAGRRGNR